MKTIARVVLKKGKEKPVLGFHPWIFSGAIEAVDDFHQAGDLVRVESSQGAYLGTGYLNTKSQIAVRLLSFGEESIDQNFFQERILRALKWREEAISKSTNCYRLIHAEGDGLPGLTVDRYADFLVVQFQTLGIEKFREPIIECLKAIPGIKGIYERSEAFSRRKEGLASQKGMVLGDTVPERIEVQENGFRFWVDIQQGQKTGFFLDQRENRALVGKYSASRDVLNCFGYTGAFSVYVLKNGARSVQMVETSEPALKLCRQNFDLNQLQHKDDSFAQADVFEFLRKDVKQYDLIILDPPAFCKSKHQIQEASRGYKDINLHAIKRLKPDGLLFTASCSSHISADLFQKIIFAAAKDAKRDLQILTKTGHPVDHPTSIYHPEGEYLKGLFCRVR